jgi:diketogulonate reductase-like aldo/keto reductase
LPLDFIDAHDDLFLPNGDILWRGAMEEIKAAGLVKKIGVSV